MTSSLILCSNIRAILFHEKSLSQYHNHNHQPLHQNLTTNLQTTTPPHNHTSTNLYSLPILPRIHPLLNLLPPTHRLLNTLPLNLNIISSNSSLLTPFHPTLGKFFKFFFFSFFANTTSSCGLRVRPTSINLWRNSLRVSWPRLAIRFYATRHSSFFEARREER